MQVKIDFVSRRTYVVQISLGSMMKVVISLTLLGLSQALNLEVAPSSTNTQMLNLREKHTSQTIEGVIYVLTYVHTYVPTYVHTYVLTYMPLLPI